MKPEQLLSIDHGGLQVVKVDIESSEPEEVKREFKTFAKAYFATFNKTPFGMQRVVGHHDHAHNSWINKIK